MKDKNITIGPKTPYRSSSIWDPIKLG